MFFLRSHEYVYACDKCASACASKRDTDCGIRTKRNKAKQNEKKNIVEQIFVQAIKYKW